MKRATKFGNYFKLPNPGLRAYFSHVRQGNDEEYRTRFYRDKSLSQILEGWAPQLRTLAKEWPSLVEFENDLRKKVGPMSIQKPLSQRLDDIDSYYESVLPGSTPIDANAVTAVCNEWRGVRGLRMRSEFATVDNMKKSTNSGSPYFTKRKTVTSKTVPCTTQVLGDTVLQTLRDSSWNACAVLGWRGQEGGPRPNDVKQRVVWMFPYAINIDEQRVYQPLIEGAQKLRLVPAWVSMEEVDRRITRLFDTKDPDDLIVCTDFEKFDQHFNTSLQDCAFSILDNLLLDCSESRRWLSDVFGIKYMIPLAYDYDQIKFGPHGMASGSGGTNADETLVHRALQYEVALRNGKILNPNSQCLGDDGILSYPGITVEDVVSSYTDHGLSMNKNKQYSDKQTCVYLRRWHHDAYRIDDVCVGVYSTYRALGRLAEQERYYDPEVWGPKMVALRQLSIIENVKYHPRFTEFVDYCMKGDKYRLGLDIPGFMESLTKQAYLAMEYMPDFMGYSKSLGLTPQDAARGINEWAVVKYLKSKA